MVPCELPFQNDQGRGRGCATYSVTTAERVDVQKGEGLVGLDELEGGDLA